MDALFEALILIGFSEEEANSQTNGLKKAIEESFTKKLVESELSNKNEQEKLLKEVTQGILGDYIEAVTKNLVPLKRDEFFAMVAEDFKQTS